MKLFNWNSDKNQKLILDRGKSFEEVIFHIQKGGLLGDIVHPNVNEHPGQRIFVACIDNYVYLIAYVEDDEEVFLKTIIPSRKFTRKYLGGANE